MNTFNYISNFRKLSFFNWMLIGICALTFMTHAYNLQYNSAFNDEASDIIVGRLGIFLGDWWAYNASSWLAGFPYIYPPMTAIASMGGGIWGSRFLNVLLGVLLVEVVYVLTVRIAQLKRPADMISGLIAAALVGGSTIGLYVNRLATYDTPSFYLFFAGLIPLLKAEAPSNNTGRYYFYASMLITLSCLTKIIIFIYVPLLIVYSFIQANRNGRSHLRFWFVYFLSPLAIVLTTYCMVNLHSLITYAHVNTTRDITPIKEFMQVLWANSAGVWLFWIVGSLGIFLQKRWKLWLILTVGGLWMMIPHFLSQRALWTFEKQILLTILFLAPICGIGISSLINLMKPRVIRIALYTMLIFFVGLYGTYSYIDAQRFNKKWANSTHALQYLASLVHNDDKVLAESGGTAILALYDKDYPTNITTFDWFKYQNAEGRSAYIAAVTDGYFDYIELEGLGQQGDQTVHKLRGDIANALVSNYHRVYLYNGFQIYERKK